MFSQESFVPQRIGTLWTGGTVRRQGIDGLSNKEKPFTHNCCTGNKVIYKSCRTYIMKSQMFRDSVNNRVERLKRNND